MTDETDEVPAGARLATAGLLGKRLSYVKSQKGLVLCAEIVLGIITLISFASSSAWMSGCIYVPIVWSVLSILSLGAFAVDLDKRTFSALRWAWFDLGRAASGAVLYLVSSVAVVARGHGSTTGAAFGLFAALAFAYDAYTAFLQLRNARKQQYSFHYNNVLPT